MKKELARSVRIPEEIATIIQEKAVNEDRSFNAQLIQFLKSHPYIKAELEKLNDEK